MTTHGLPIYGTAPFTEPTPELDEHRALAEHRALQAKAAARHPHYVIEVRPVNFRWRK